MKWKFYYKKTPQFIDDEGDVELDNFDIGEFLKTKFPKGKASLTQIKEVLPPKQFKEFCTKTNTIYIGVNDE